jgi:glycosyltransferase involved in cell wall biosynthesis
MNLQPPLVSVVIPVYNGAHWLAETLKSLADQTYQNFEIILADDASTDNLQQVLDGFCDKRLRAVHLKNNVGVSAGRNLGIELAKGEFIAFCDADDICQPARLERQVSFLLSHPEVDMCGSAFTCFSDAQTKQTITHPLTHQLIHKALMQGNCFGLSTVMVRSNLLKANHFDEALNAAEDYELWTRLAAKGACLANLSESLVLYRLHASQASDRHGDKLDQLTRQIRALYCAILLDGASAGGNVYKRVQHTQLTLDDFLSLASTINSQKKYQAQDFRFMLAWAYQKLQRHGIREWLVWTSIQKSLQLKLDRNYRINVLILSFLPQPLKTKYFSTLIKLKR